MSSKTLQPHFCFPTPTLWFWRILRLFSKRTFFYCIFSKNNFNNFEPKPIEKISQVYSNFIIWKLWNFNKNVPKVLYILNYFQFLIVSISLQAWKASATSNFGRRKKKGAKLKFKNLYIYDKLSAKLNFFAQYILVLMIKKTCVPIKLLRKNIIYIYILWYDSYFSIWPSHYLSICLFFFFPFF